MANNEKVQFSKGSLMALAQCPKRFYLEICQSNGTPELSKAERLRA